MPEIVNIPFPEDETLPPLSTTNEGGEDVAAEDGTTTTTTTTTPKKSHNRTGKKATADVEYPNILMAIASNGAREFQELARFGV
jgi:hypothetical protein